MSALTELAPEHLGEHTMETWEDDKANGYGIYIHVNGAQYEGYWKNDL